MTLRLDNVVFNASGFLRTCADAALLDLGLAPLEDHEHRNLFLDGDELGFVTVLMDRESGNITRDTCDLLTSTYRDRVDQGILEHVFPVEGIVDCLRELDSGNIRIGGFTELRREHAMALLAAHNIDSLFEVVAYHDSGLPGRRPGELALRGLAAMVPADNRTAVVSDHQHNLQAAVLSGSRSIAARWGMTQPLVIDIMAAMNVDSVRSPAHLPPKLAPSRTHTHAPQSDTPRLVLFRLEAIYQEEDASLDEIKGLGSAFPEPETIRRLLTDLRRDEVWLGTISDQDDISAMLRLVASSYLDLFQTIHTREDSEIPPIDGIVEKLIDDLPMQERPNVTIVTNSLAEAIEAVTAGYSAVTVTWTDAYEVDLDLLETLDDHALSRIRVARTSDQLTTELARLLKTA